MTPVHSLTMQQQDTTEPTNDTPSSWLEQLSHQGVLRWKHGNDNIGLLLASLLDINGWQGNVLDLCDALPISAKAVTIQDILTVMGTLGYLVQSEHISTANLKPKDMPALFVPDQPKGWHAGMVLREIGAYGLIWDDGRTQHRGELPAKEGTIYRFERVNLDNTPETYPSRSNDWLTDMSKRFYPLLWHAFGLSFVMYLFTLAMPMFSMVVYDRVISSHSVDTLPMLVAGVLLALFMEHTIRWMRIRLTGWIGARSSQLSTAAMLERLLFLPSSVIEQASISSQLARIRAFEAVRDFITSPVFLSILEIPFLTILIMVIAMIAGPVALVSIATLMVQIVLALILKPSWRTLGKDTAHTAAARQQLLMDALENIRPVYTAGLSDCILQRFKQISWQAARANYRFGMSSAIVQHLAGLLTIIAGVATIAWSLDRIWAGEMTGGAMVATMILTWRILYPLQNLYTVLPNIEQIQSSLQQVSFLMRQAPEAHAAHVVLAEHTLKGKVSIQNLGLRYGRKTDPVFMGLTCEIEPGEIVAIYGGNGSGKSSILRLLLGLYAPTMGSIRLNGVDHRQFDPRNLRRQIAYLPQIPELLPGSIADNLRTHNPLAPEHKLRQALLWADAWETVEQLPAGLHTKLGEGGYVPSSGFASRLILARLYLSDRSLIVCDELPSQLLNSATGKRFLQFIEECKGKRTVLFVTLREDWLKVADKVIWFRPDSKPLVVRPKQEI